MTEHDPYPAITYRDAPPEIAVALGHDLEPDPTGTAVLRWTCTRCARPVCLRGMRNPYGSAAEVPCTNVTSVRRGPLGPAGPRTRIVP